MTQARTKRLVTEAAMPIIDVKSLGAVGDGVANDTTAISTALSMADQSGGIVWVPDGVYMISSVLTIGAKTTLRMAPGAILRAASTISGPMVMTPLTTLVVDREVMTGGQIDCNGLADVGLQLSYFQHVTVRDVSVHTWKTRAFVIGAPAAPVKSYEAMLYNLHTWRSSSSTTPANSRGISFDNASDCVLNSAIINGADRGMHTDFGGHTIVGVHVWNFAGSGFTTTSFYDNGGNNTYINPYADGFSGNAFVFMMSGCTLISPFVLHGANPDNTGTVFVNGQSYAMDITVIGGRIDAAGTNRIANDWSGNLGLITYLGVSTHYVVNVTSSRSRDGSTGVIPPSGDTTGATDTASINTALAACGYMAGTTRPTSNILTVTLGPGPYYINPNVLTVRPAQRLVGNSPVTSMVYCVGGTVGQVFINRKDPSFSLIGVDLTSQGGEVSNITLDGSKAGTGTVGIQCGDALSSRMDVVVQKFGGNVLATSTGTITATVGGASRPSTGITANSHIVTDAAAAIADIGATVTGTNIPTGSYVGGVVAGVSYVMSYASRPALLNCTATGTITAQIGFIRSDASVGTTSGSPTITDAAATANDLGSYIYGTGIPVGAVIVGVTPGVSYTIGTAAKGVLYKNTNGWYERNDDQVMCFNNAESIVFDQGSPSAYNSNSYCDYRFDLRMLHGQRGISVRNSPTLYGTKFRVTGGVGAVASPANNGIFWHAYLAGGMALINLDMEVEAGGGNNTYTNAVPIHLADTGTSLNGNGSIAFYCSASNSPWQAAKRVVSALSAATTGLNFSGYMAGIANASANVFSYGNPTWRSTGLVTPMVGSCGIAGSTITVYFGTGNYFKPQTLTAGTNYTLAFDQAISVGASSVLDYRIVFQQPASGTPAAITTWPSGVTFIGTAGPTVPVTLDTKLGSRTVIYMLSTDGASTWTVWRENESLSDVFSVESAAAGTSTAGAVISCPPAASPLSIATYDGGNHATHPSVQFVPEGWNGYRYWMALTPYNGTDSTIENPSIYRSQDGETWAAPTGLTNPIDPHPGSTNYNSDPCLAFGPDGRLYCFWRAFISSQERIYYRSSSDGVDWSDKQLIMTNDPAVRRPTSPAVLWDGGAWHMWAVDIVPSPNTVIHCSTTNSIPMTGWSAWGTVSGLTARSGRDIWHIDVHRDGGELALIYVDNTRDGSDGGGLYRAVSRGDGTTWVQDSAPFLPPVAGTWAALLYKSCARPAHVNGRTGYELWYSSSGPNYDIGHTFASLSPPPKTYQDDPANMLAGIRLLGGYLLCDLVDRADSATAPGSATSGQAWVISAGNGSFGVSSHAFYATAATNCRAYIDVAATDVEVGVTLKALAAVEQQFVISRLTDDSNYIRAGLIGNGWQVQTVIAGSATALANQPMTLYPAVAGQRIRLVSKGQVHSLYVDDYLLGQGSTASLTTGTKVGFQFQNTTTRMTNFYTKTA